MAWHFLESSARSRAGCPDTGLGQALGPNSSRRSIYPTITSPRGRGAGGSSQSSYQARLQEEQRSGLAEASTRVEEGFFASHITVSGEATTRVVGGTEVVHLSLTRFQSWDCTSAFSTSSRVIAKKQRMLPVPGGDAHSRGAGKDPHVPPPDAELCRTAHLFVLQPVIIFIVCMALVGFKSKPGLLGNSSDGTCGHEARAHESCDKDSLTKKSLGNLTCACADRFPWVLSWKM